jgi:nucleoside-diphosphate-sugar epimerase
VRVTVTGASGFVGQAICRSLCALGWSVRGVVRRPLSGGPGCGYVRADLLDAGTARTALADTDVVIHAAGLAHVPLRRQDEGELFRHNVLMTRHVAEAAAELGVRLLYVSSHAAAAERTPYGRSKRLAEVCLEEVGRSRGLWWAAVRPALLFGEGDPGNFLRLLVAVSRRRIVYIDRGRARKSLTYVGNVGPALAALARFDEPRQRIYGLADPRPYTVREIVEGISAQLGLSPPRISLAAPVARVAGLIGTALAAAGLPAPIRLDLVDTLCRDVIVDTRPLQEETGFSPPIPFDEGVRKTIEWCRDHHIVG